jgi:hypothetical protein
MFDVTLVNLASDARSASTDRGSSDLGTLTADELSALLENFRELDPVQNLEADPQIAVVTRREKHVIRTGQKKLFFYNARHLDEPAQTLTATGIIAELDGTAAVARTVSSLPPDLPRVEETSVAVTAVAPAEVPSLRWRLALAAIACALAGYIVYSMFRVAGGIAPSPLRPIADPTELAADRASLVGVYLTGSEPGQHGIAVLADDTLKLFQINAQVAPSMIYGTYRLGRRGAALGLATDQPGGVIDVRDHDTLVYCGETYKRIP